MILLVPSLAWGQVPPAAQETLDQLQNSPGLTISTAQPCCKPSIWDCLGVQQMQDHCHETLHKIAELPLFKSLLQTLNTGLQAAGLAPPPEGGPGAPGGGPGAGGADPAAGGGAAGGVAAKIEADKKAADAKVATLEYLGQQDCNAYPEIIPALLEALDDPIERVRYAALVALMRQCKELRCSTLPATRLKYRLHDQTFIDHCRQCASCACQQAVIKRLSELLLDETALGYPKENSPRVRSLAASIIERCLQVHPVAPAGATPSTQGVQPDPIPTPVPDPLAAEEAERFGARFPSAPLFRTRASAQRTGWWRKLLGDRRAPDARQAQRRLFRDTTIYRGQSPEHVFEPAPDQFQQWHTWNAAAAQPAPSRNPLPVPADLEVPLPPRGVPRGVPQSAEAAAQDDGWSRMEMLQQILAESEATIRATAAERDGATREQFEQAVAALCDARLALALEGDQSQLGSLYDDAVSLCQNSPNSTAAATALEALTRYYAARAGGLTPDGIAALRQYVDCLEYRLTRFDHVPPDVPQALFQAARALHRAGLVDEATVALQHVIANCPDPLVAGDAAALLSGIETAGAPVELTSGQTSTGVAGGIAGFDQGALAAEPPASAPPVEASGAGSAVHLAWADLPPETAGSPPLSPREQWLAVVGSAEQAARASFSRRHGDDRRVFESAVAELCEARLQLALDGDDQQFQELNDDAEGLCARDPGSAAAATAMNALTRYYAAKAGEDTDAQRAALRQYATCLRYCLVNFESCPEDVPVRLLDASDALRRIGCPDEAVACLQRIVTYCPVTAVASEAAALLAEHHTPATPPTVQPVADATGTGMPAASAPPASPVTTAPAPAPKTQVASAPADETASNVPEPEAFIPAVPPAEASAASAPMQSAPVAAALPADAESERQWLYESVAQAEQTIRATFADRSGAAKAEFESALTLLCEARLQLALQGDQRQFEELYDDAETLCREAPNSPPARIAMEALTAYYAAQAGEETPEQRDALRRYAGCLRFRVSRFPADAAQCAEDLLHASRALHHLGVDEDAASGFRTIVKHCSGTSSASLAHADLQAIAPSQPPATRNAAVPAEGNRPIAKAAASAPPRSASPEDTVPPIVAAGAEHSVASRTDSAGTTLAPRPLEGVAVASAALQAPPPPPVPAAEGLPPLPVDAAPVPATTILEPIEDPFGPNPLAPDIVDLAREALQANEFAYLHLQEEDDIVERYNNSVGIKIAPYSLFHIDGAQPGNVFRVGFNSVFNYHRPDRSEYFWAGTGAGGPKFQETDLNYQQIYVYNETAPSDFASAFTEYPIYILDPEQNSNTAGPGDITIGMKAVLIKDENWTVTSITKTYTPVGVKRRGLGRGHLALEQGVAVQLRAGRRMFVNADLKFHYPIAADPDFGGEVLIGGIGFSRVLWTDPIAPPIGRSRALLLTGETVITSFLDGFVTEPGALLPRDAEMTSVIQNFGLRAIWTKRFSTGWSFGFPLSTSHTHDFNSMFEFQWVH